ncbi:hypothetical protein PF004_g14923 [Phytophthora fragariae]|uniref:SWIM-type domain-containing protein n=1 Tax=Phytophthora fragariae TaxID=53985 RepID=A0A6G0NMT6_9STRA|nr:hypothetical protein PF004_g14923 [Phytophthora fragariae]
MDGCDIAPEDELVHAKELDKKLFDSWGALELYLKNYGSRTYQIFTIRTNTPVRVRNSRIEPSKKQDKHMIPDSIVFYNKTYACTHSGESRRSRSQGTRPIQHSRKIGCPAQINACVRETGSGSWEVFVTRQVTGHNHEVGREIFQTYHQARQVSDDEVLATVHTLYRAGASRKRILEYITENTEVEPAMQDVHNLVARLRLESYAFPTIEECIHAILEDFASQKGNLTRVYANEENVVECIIIQSSHMRAMFELFPEVVLIDATHDTNASNYKLFSFMIHDAMGKGQHVQHCLIENERKETLRIACRQFKEGCPNYDSIVVIMIDKDFTELAVLQEEFPGARILLCHFHVVKYLQEEVAKEKYNLDAWTKNEMKRLIQLLVGAPTEVAYANIITTMKMVLRTDEKKKLWFSDFDKNWTKYKERWSSAYRGNVPHMGNHTNNRLESSWQKLKTLVNRSTTLDDCVVSILFWQTVNEGIWARNIKRIGVYMNMEYDNEMNQLLNEVSRHAVELIKQQYDFALHSTTKYHYYPVGPYVMMQYTSAKDDDLPDEYTMNPDGWTCSCMFRVTRLLPCRHIIYYRKDTGCSRLVPKTTIHPRWLVKSYRKLKNATVADDDVAVAYEDRYTPSQSIPRIKNENEKCKELFALGRQIADVGSNWGTNVHTTLAKSLTKFLEGVKAGQCPTVTIEDRPSSTDAEASSDDNSPMRQPSSSGDQSEVVAHSNDGHPPVTDRQSETVLPGADGPSSKSGEIQLSPETRAVYEFINDLDPSSLHQTELLTNDTSGNHDNTRVNVPEVVVSAEIVEQSETVHPSNEKSSTNSAASSTSDNDSDEQTPLRPRWMLSKVTNKAGRARITQPERKKAGLKESEIFVAAVAAGADPSVAVLEEAHKWSHLQVRYRSTSSIHYPVQRSQDYSRGAAKQAPNAHG